MFAVSSVSHFSSTLKPHFSSRLNPGNKCNEVLLQCLRQPLCPAPFFNRTLNAQTSVIILYPKRDRPARVWESESGTIVTLEKALFWSFTALSLTYLIFNLHWLVKISSGLIILKTLSYILIIWSTARLEICLPNGWAVFLWMAGAVYFLKNPPKRCTSLTLNPFWETPSCPLNIKCIVPTFFWRAVSRKRIRLDHF